MSRKPRPGSGDPSEETPDPGDPAYITDEDIERPKSAWREAAPAAMRYLLDAEPVDDDEPPVTAERAGE